MIDPWLVVAAVFGGLGVLTPWVLPRLLDWWSEWAYQRDRPQLLRETRKTGNEDQETLTP